jgi:hypothetical protein
MYVHIYYRGPRRGSRSVEYFNDLTQARLELVEEDGGVLRVSTQDGYIHLTMGAEELRLLARAFSSRAERSTKRRPRSPRVVSSPPSPSSEPVEPLSYWERLLDRARAWPEL